MSTVSACLIVRDEEQNLELCLEALAPWVDELCVLDTGSRDASVRVAGRHGARIGHFEWCDDFSAARNACLELATREWILTVDADELLDSESAPVLRQLLADPAAQSWLVWIDNLAEAPLAGGAPRVHSVAIPRLFRRRPEFYYTRRVHESIMDSLIAAGAPQPAPSGLRLVHSGYLPQVVRARKKRERNLAILEAERVRAPDDVFNAYKLASTYVTLERDAEALGVLRPGWTRAYQLSDGERARLPFLPLVAAELARLELRAGELSRALGAAREGLEDAPQVSELRYQRAEVERRAGRYRAAHELYAAARAATAWTDLLRGDPATRGVKPLVGIAKSAAMLGDLSMARDALREARDLAPEDLEARTLEARLAAVAGEEQASWSALASLLDEAPGNGHVALLAAEMAWARGERETALGFWKGALETGETRSMASAWLAVAALVAGDLDAAAGANFAAADLPQAAARVVLGVVGERPFALDPQFERPRVLEEVHAWLAELVRDPSHGALRLFRERAPGHEQALPGISGLLAGR